MTSAYTESADWIQLGVQNELPVYYKKHELYSMHWKNFDLDAVLIAVASFGGAIATVRHPRKLIRLDFEGSNPNIRMYSSAGVEMASVLWDKKAAVNTLGWTEDEKLCVLSDEGIVYVYTLHGEFVRLFSCGMNAELDSILEARFFGNSLVVMTKEHAIYIVKNVHEPKFQIYTNPRLGDEHPYCIEPVPGTFTLSTTAEILISPRTLAPQPVPVPEVRTKGKQPIPQPVVPEQPTILETGVVTVVDAAEASSHTIQDSSPFLRFSMSPNGQLLASFDTQGRVQVMKSDFSRRLSSFSTKSKVPPRQLVWCGIDALVLVWDPEQLKGSQSLVLMVGPYGDFEKFMFDGPVHLVSEVDGLRIISNTSCEFLQRVPSSLVDIFRIGSVEPSALLFDAFQEYERKNPACIKNIRAIKDQLTDAVDACVEAAGAVFNVELQRGLLRAASFGKSFCEFYSADTFVDMCRALRVLNAVRDDSVGLPLTIGQYERLGPETVVRKLVERNKHLLAVRVCDWLRLKVDMVLVHWACQKVKFDSSPDQEILQIIREKLSNFSNIPYHEIASAAFQGGKRKLAIQLLEMETNPAKQVPLLLSMNEFDLALDKAVSSGDPDLVFVCIFHIRETEEADTFMNQLKRRPLARDLYVGYTRTCGAEELRNVYLYMELLHEAGMAKIMDAFTNFVDVPDAIAKLRAAADDFNVSSKDFQGVSRLCEEQVELLQSQKAAEEHSGDGGSLTFSSVSDTIYTLISSGDFKSAERFRSQFKVTDKKFWWIKVKALGVSRNWEGLEKFAKEKKSPIGYEPFVQVCIANGNRLEGEKYVVRVANTRTRAELWMEIGNVDEASQTAFQAKDVQMLEIIRDRCEYNKRLQAQVEQLISKLQAP
eukprot:ANDGO_04278.mRNA.1 Vacuolar protein sorting-associated protein 16 homolog